MPERMLEVALRAAVLHDADGRTLRTLGDLVGSLPPADPAEPAAQPPALPADLALADAVGTLLSGPHAARGLAVRWSAPRVTRSRTRPGTCSPRLAAALAHSTLLDPLTGLPTRRWVLDEVDRRLAGASPAAPLGAAAGRARPAQGHQRQPRVRAGRRADHGGGPPAGRPRSARPDAVGRLVGDEFAIVLGELPADDPIGGAAEAARRVLDLLAEGVRLGEHELQMRASVGVCVVDGTGDQRRARAPPGGQRDDQGEDVRPWPGRALRPDRRPAGGPALADPAAARGAWPRTRSRCTGSRSTGCATAPWSGPRRWCAGRTSTACRSRRTSSSRTRRPSG